MDLHTGMVVPAGAAAHLRGYASLAGDQGTPAGEVASCVKVQDNQGYVWRVFSDGSIWIVDGPVGVGTRYLPGSIAYEQVLAHVRSIDGRVDQLLAHYLVPTAEEIREGFAGWGQTPQSAEEITWAPAAETATVEPAGSGFKVDWSQVASAVTTLAPVVVPAVAQTVQQQRATLQSLYTRLARKRAQYAKAKRPAKRARLAAEIRTLEEQIKAALQAQQAALAQASGSIPVPRSGLPTWAPWAIGGTLVVVALAIGLGAAGRRR